jgi:hypothetical protein
MTELPQSIMDAKDCGELVALRRLLRGPISAALQTCVALAEAQGYQARIFVCAMVEVLNIEICGMAMDMSRGTRAEDLHSLEAMENLAQAVYRQAREARRETP